MTENKENTRNSLLSQKMGFNQMRNSLYWLQRYMKRFNLSQDELERRYLDMGRNIGATFIKEITPQSKELKNLFRELYNVTLSSKVKVLQEGNIYTIQDSKCALCKYQYDDIDIAGCTIEIGMISEMLQRLGYQVVDNTIIESKTYGHKHCIHQYTANKKGFLHE